MSSFEIEYLSGIAIQRLYKQIVMKLTEEEWRKLRTNKYWEERDEIQHWLEKQRYTVRAYMQMKEDERYD